MGWGSNAWHGQVCGMMSERNNRWSRGCMFMPHTRQPDCLCYPVFPNQSACSFPRFNCHIFPLQSNCNDSSMRWCYTFLSMRYVIHFTRIAIRNRYMRSFPAFSRVVNRKMYALKTVSKLFTTEPWKMTKGHWANISSVVTDSFWLLFLGYGFKGYFIFYILINTIVTKHYVQQFL